MHKEVTQSVTKFIVIIIVVFFFAPASTIGMVGMTAAHYYSY